jgi:hypothetical protein
MTAPVALLEHTTQREGTTRCQHLLVIREGLLKPPALWILGRLLRRL